MPYLEPRTRIQGLLPLLALTVCGCIQPDDGIPSYAEPECTETRHKVALDESLQGGWTAQQVLDFAIGSESGLLEWDGNGTLTESYRDHTTGLTFELAFAGTASWVDAEVANPEELLPGTNACADRLELEVTYTFQTEDGDFDEQGSAVLVSVSPGSADIRIELDPAGLGGDFEPDEVWIDADLHAIGIEATRSPEDQGGGLYVEVDEHTIPGFGLGYTALWGSWPLDEGL